MPYTPAQIERLRAELLTHLTLDTPAPDSLAAYVLNVAAIHFRTGDYFACAIALQYFHYFHSVDAWAHVL